MSRPQHLAIHGARAEVHDHHAGEGSFAAATALLGAARRAGLAVVVTTALTRSTYHVIGELPLWLASRGVAAWCIEPVIATGSADDASDRVVPRLALALPYALHALTAAREKGIATFLRGAPLCLLGPLASHALSAEPRSYGAPCSACPARASCAGVDARYLARFGEGELRACDPPPPTSDSSWARAFVEPDELGPGITASLGSTDRPLRR